MVASVCARRQVATHDRRKISLAEPNPQRRDSLSVPAQSHEEIVMILRIQLLAALAAATLAPAAFSQEPPAPPPSAQDPDTADVGEPAPSQQQDLPPTTTDEQTTPGAATDSSTAGPIEDKKIE